MSGEAPTAETPTDHESGAAPATGGAAAIPEPSGDGRNAGASGSNLGIRDVPGTSGEERHSAGGDVQAHEFMAGAKRRKKNTPQSITQQALEAMHARQQAYTRGIGGVGVEPNPKTEPKPERKPDAPYAVAGPMAPVTASALRGATAAQISQIPVFKDQRMAADAAKAYENLVVPSYQSQHESREPSTTETKTAPPTLLPRPSPPLAPPGPTKRASLSGYDSTIQEKIDEAVERNRLQRAAEMAAASAAIQAAQAAQAAQQRRDQDGRGVVSTQRSREVWGAVARESAATRSRHDASAPPVAAKSASALDRARAVLRAEDPTDTDRFFVASPAERCQMLIRRKDALQEELEHAVGALEAERAQLQLLHEWDPCCFRGQGRHPQIRAYNEQVQAALVGAKGGFMATAVTVGDFHEVNFR